MTSGFNYPDGRHTRQHGPQGYADYESYRPWLRDEFGFRCVYCLIREQWGRVTGEFSLDHYVPQCFDPRTADDYDNLLYSCVSCNAVKGDQVVADPLRLTAQEVVVHEDGSLEGLTDDASRLIRVLDLDDAEHRRWRRTWLRILELAERYDAALFRELMRFPDDLPDLARLRPPGGNTRPQGIEQSCFERRKRRALAETY